jgi:hypothetical protein
MKKIFIPVFLVLVSCSEPSNKELQSQINGLRDTLWTLHQSQSIDNDRNDIQDDRLDSLSSAVVFVGSIAVKHDSVIADKQWKRDRAERRGKFWGGLIGTLVK